MAYVETSGRVSVPRPEVKYENGKAKALGHCWVKDDQLECYGWTEETMLIILDKLPASDDHIPEDSYYCWNIYEDSYGWALANQITFELESLIGDEPWRLPTV
jgi:hypothetical protein